MTGKTQKPKSPATPSRSLGDAIGDVEKLYREYSHSAFSRSEIASAFGVSATSGPFASRLFSLRELKLLDGAASTFTVSQLFKDIQSAPNGSAKAKTLCLQAIRGSTVFGELLDEFKNKLPSTDAVATRLENQKRFNKDRAQQAAAVLQKSLQFAGLLDANNNILPARDGAGDGDVTSTAGKSDSEKEAESADEPLLPPQPNHLRSEIPIGEGRRVVVLYPDNLKADEAKKVGNVLAALVG